MPRHRKRSSAAPAGRAPLIFVRRCPAPSPILLAAVRAAATAAVTLAWTRSPSAVRGWPRCVRLAALREACFKRGFCCCDGGGGAASQRAHQGRYTVCCWASCWGVLPRRAAGCRRGPPSSLSRCTLPRTILRHRPVHVRANALCGVAPRWYVWCGAPLVLLWASVACELW